MTIKAYNQVEMLSLKNVDLGVHDNQSMWK